MGLKDALSGGSSDDDDDGSGDWDSGTDGDFDSGAGSEPFELDEEEKMTPDEAVVGEKAKDMAGKNDPNYDKGTGSISDYRRRQVKECEEFYDEMVELAEEHTGEAIQVFSEVMYAVLMNMANNRAGIARTLNERFGMSRSRALAETRKICDKAGEKEAFEKVTHTLTKALTEEL